MHLCGAFGCILAFVFSSLFIFFVFFFFQAEDGIRDLYVTGVQTCALPISYRVPATSSYWIAVSSLAGHVVGKFKLAMKCAASGCTPPIISKSSPVRSTVLIGNRAELNVETTSDPKTIYEWYELDVGLPIPVPGGITATLLTEPVTRPKSYYVIAYTPCGSVTSDLFVVEPGAGRREAARH